MPPLGLAYLAGSLIEAGHQVEILDMVAESDKRWSYNETHEAHGMTDQGLIDKINRVQPDMIGIGGFITQNPRIQQITEIIKLRRPSTTVVLGGINASTQPRYLMENTKADYLIQGPGETGVVELAYALENNDIDSIRNIDGIGFRQNKEIVIKPRLSFPDDLDSLPLPAHHLFKHASYIADNVGMPVVTSRSCPGRCTFCAVHPISGTRWRGREPKLVVDEIEAVVNRWGYQNVVVMDDACNVLPDRLIAICRELAERDVSARLTFPGGLIMKSITREVLYWIKRAGAVSLSLPVEHANEYMRNTIIKKNLNVEKITNVLKWCWEERLLALVNFVIGMPGETEESLKEIRAFVQSYSKYIASIGVYFATPYPGTAFYDRCVSEGLLAVDEDTDFLDYDLYTAHINTDTMPPWRLREYKELIEETFLECKGSQFSAQDIRKAIRRPNKETINYVNKVYFATA